MTRAEHYVRAEALLEAAAGTEDAYWARHLTAQAEVHALLALASGRTAGEPRVAGAALEGR